MNIRSGLAAGGVFAAVAVAASGCGSSASTTPSGGTSGSAVSAAKASASNAGPSGSTATNSANPSWAAGLGPGVTVIAPTSPAAGNGSPQAVVTGATAAENSGNYTSVCAYYEPSLQSECRSQVSAESSASPSAMASQIGTIKNLAIGYTAIRGDQALVGGRALSALLANAPRTAIRPRCSQAERRSVPCGAVPTIRTQAFTRWPPASRSTGSGTSTSPRRRREARSREPREPPERRTAALARRPPAPRRGSRSAG